MITDILLNNERILDEIMTSLKLAYLTEKKDDLCIYGVPERYLGKYTKTSRGNQKGNKIPHHSFLLQEECLGMINSRSVNQSSTLTKQLSMGSDEFEMLTYEPKSNQNKSKKNSQYKKSHSAVCSDEETKEKLLEISCDKDDYSSCDEEQKILDEISDDENDISFNLDDEDFDIFNERSETIYSKKDKFDNIKAKDFILKK